mgnify:CR=1 FL=1
MAGNIRAAFRLLALAALLLGAWFANPWRWDHNIGNAQTFFEDNVQTSLEWRRTLSLKGFTTLQLSRYFFAQRQDVQGKHWSEYEEPDDRSSYPVGDPRRGHRLGHLRPAGQVQRRARREAEFVELHLAFDRVGEFRRNLAAGESPLHLHAAETLHDFLLGVDQLGLAAEVGHLVGTDDPGIGVAGADCRSLGAGEAKGPITGRLTVPLRFVDTRSLRQEWQAEAGEEPGPVA